MTDTATGATASGERIDLLDGLRGFALGGILLANLQEMTGWIFLRPAEQVALAGAGVPEVSGFAWLMLIDGKFYTIFSLLFGISFALQLARLDARGAGGIAIYRRRLLGLLAIGVIHLVFLWDGDILTLYALSGFALLAIRRWRDRTLLICAVLLILFPVLGEGIAQRAGMRPDFGLWAIADRYVATFGVDALHPVELMNRPGWEAYWGWHSSGVLYRIAYLLDSWRIPKVLAIMMIGLWAGRRLIDGRLLTDRALLRRVLIAGLLIGLPANAALAWFGGLNSRDLLATLFYTLGVVPLALAYAAGFALLWPRIAPSAAPLAAAGRMALTNYIGHSVIWLVVFTGLGFGLAGTVGPLGIVAFWAVVIALQLVVSQAWLARYRQGPLESLWRAATYGRRVRGAAPV